MEKVEAMVRGVKALGMETCATLGMLEEGQAEQLKQAGDFDYAVENDDRERAADRLTEIVSGLLDGAGTMSRP